VPEESPLPEVGTDAPVNRPIRRRRAEEDDYGDYDDDHYRRRRRRDVAPHRGGVVLTLGILSLVLGCLGIIFGPIAWAMGTTDLAEIRAGRMDPEGEGTTNAGRICGIIGTIVSVAFVACGLLSMFANMNARRW
jgi:hypothetical protein